MMISSQFVLLFFMMKRAPLIFREAWKDAPNPNGDADPQEKPKLSLISLIGKLLKIVFLVLKSIDVLYYIAYGLLAIAGIAVHPFFFSFHLTEILIRY